MNTPSPNETTELEDFVLDLLRIPSVIGEERALCEHVERFAREAGAFAVTRADDNLALQPRPFEEGLPKLLLLGHLDTVPKSDENPARIDGDRIYGLGASDMKGADALMLRLFQRAIHEAPLYNLSLVLYAREEGPYHESGMPEIQAAAPGAFQDCALAIAMEPTDNRIELGCLGTMHAMLRFQGKRAHSARPWQGRNAIHMAAPLLAELAALPLRKLEFSGLKFQEACSATMIDFDGARNVVPERCQVNLNFRFGPDRDRADAIQWIHDLLARCCDAEDLASGAVSVEITDFCPSGKVCADNALLAQLKTAGDAPLEIAAKQAWTDVGRLSQMGIDALNFGPGSSSQAHQRGEYCERSKLREAEEILGRFLFGDS